MTPTNDFPAAARALRATADDAGAYARLVVTDAPPADPALRQRLAALAAAAPASDDAQAAAAGLWLWHDFLHESHTISQSLPTPAGSYWHAIMHRREGDFSNAKYWYARCRRHPVLEELPARVGDVASLAAPGLRPLVRGGAWDPDAFVDLVERVHDRPADPLHEAAVQLQRLEWEALFEHCLARVAGHAGGI
jgi:hypothetical protein